MGLVGAVIAQPTPPAPVSTAGEGGQPKPLLAAGRWPGPLDPSTTQRRIECYRIDKNTKIKHRCTWWCCFFSVFEMKRSRAVYKVANSYSKRDLVFGSSYPCRTRNRIPDWISRSIPKCHAEAIVVLLPFNGYIYCCVVYHVPHRACSGDCGNGVSKYGHRTKAIEPSPSSSFRIHVYE